MSRQIEHAIRQQLGLLNDRKSTAAQAAEAIAALGRSSDEARRLVNETLAERRLTGNSSLDVAQRVAPFVSSEVDGATVDLHPDIDRPLSIDSNISPSISVGCVLRERYVIQERLSTGGKGAVFKALDRYRSSRADSPRYVAVKVLHVGRNCSEQTITLLEREVHCGQMMSHRNIVKVFELDRDGDVMFLTMEFLEGELLSALIDRMRPTAMQPRQAWQIIRQLGAGLQHAHEHGVVHGDLKPRNIFVTWDGELRILDFGAARNIARVPADPGHPDRAPVSVTPAYASCEMLEGRCDADPRDDLYSLGCICYELMTGLHPFAGRPATLARNYGVKAPRPACFTSRQWRTLQGALSWHRAGRSMSVQTCIRRLTRDFTDEPSITPLHQIRAASSAKPMWHTRAAAAFLAVLVIYGVLIGALRDTSTQRPRDGAAPAGRDFVKVPTPKAALSSEPPPPDIRDVDAQVAREKYAVHGMAQVRAAARAPPLRISVDGYQVAGDRFIEIRVRRNQLQKDASFVWWTEPATARENVDYVHQAKAIQTFPTGRRSTRFYVKLLRESKRTQRDYFYVAIALRAHDQISDKVVRAPIWLPTPHDQLQARR